MNELRKHIENKTLFAYTLSDGGTGIVVADDKDKAKAKVREAYQKNGGYENGNVNGIDINISIVCQPPFANAPDVLEILEY